MADDAASARADGTSDEALLRRTFEVAAAARSSGNHPFGALLAGPDGSILMEQQNSSFFSISRSLTTEDMCLDGVVHYSKPSACLVVRLRDVLGARDHERRPREGARVERRAVAGVGETLVSRQALADDLLG